MENFSAIGLKDIPQILESHVDTINNYLQSIIGNSSSISSTIGGNIGQGWSDIASTYSKINAKVSELTNKLVNDINTYISTTLENETSTANDYSSFNDDLSRISNLLDNITI